MTTKHGFEDVVEAGDDLAQYYRAPNEMVLAKETEVLDDGCRDFIARSTFVLVGTSDADGKLDVSPRGGPAGFVKVLDEQRLAIPDLNGNNRLDSIRNVVEQGRVGLLFVVPGLGETLRINGDACVTTDPAVLDLFADELRRPVTAIGVSIDQGFIQCAKALRRGGIWDPESWPKRSEQPSPAQMLVDHSGANDVISGPELEELLEASYEADLKADAPE